MSRRPTFVSLFSGGGGADIGARDAGFEIAGGLEREKEIAKWYALNLGHQPIIDSIENVQPAQFDVAPDWLHASPPCQGDSRARTNAKVSAHPDLAAGLEVCRFIRAWHPAYFTLENVEGYAHNPALHAIENCLFECGYWVRRQVLDASEFGIPQSRRRLWIIASRITMPMLPTPSAHKVGWYPAIADLIPSLRETRLSPWQLRGFDKNQRMPAGDLLIANSNTSSAVRRFFYEPAMTIGKSKDSALPKVYLVSELGNKSPVRKSLSPAYTVMATDWKRPQKVLSLDESDYLPTASVFITTPRCAARFQTFPDSYELPAHTKLAAAIIGNAVPPRLAQLIGQSFNF